LPGATLLCRWLGGVGDWPCRRGMNEDRVALLSFPAPGGRRSAGRSMLAGKASAPRPTPPGAGQNDVLGLHTGTTRRCEPVNVLSCRRWYLSFFCRYTTGIATGADGLHLRRWPNVGVIGVGGLQATQPTRPLVYGSPRHSPRYADSHPRRLQAVSVCRGHVSLQVQGGPALSRCYIYADNQGQIQDLSIGGARKAATIYKRYTTKIYELS
jgi:hypothetical protein